MPALNVIKPYVSGGFYHLYNRTHEHTLLFQDNQDYQCFLALMRKYLAPERKIDPITSLNNPLSLADEVDLLTFSLMPNHFHFLLQQKTVHGISNLSRRVLTSYALFYNEKYKRKGSLFEGKLRGILVENDSYLLHLSRYIHRNSFDSNRIPTAATFQYSSYLNYIGGKRDSWIKPGLILNFFSTKAHMSYQHFVEYEHEESDTAVQGLTLE